MIYKILIVENDMEKIISLLDRMEFNDLKAELVKTETQAIKQAIKGDYEVVLIDTDCFDGVLITQKILEKKKMPIIHFGDEKEIKEIVRAYNAGAVEYLQYPFNFEISVAKIRALAVFKDQLEKQFTQEADQITIRDIVIDLNSRKVYIAGVEKVLTTREFELLVFFAKHPNRVYTREQLFSEIWGMKSIGNIATVTVHIKKLREKIESGKERDQYIETLWGAGYRFKE